MGNYEIGYGRPPKHMRFKKGVCPNPRGRGKSKELPVAKIMDGVLNALVEFHDQGKLKKASRLELLIKKLFIEALKGDVGSAGQIADPTRPRAQTWRSWTNDHQGHWRVSAQSFGRRVIIGRWLIERQASALGASIARFAAILQLD